MIDIKHTSYNGAMGIENISDLSYDIKQILTGKHVMITGWYKDVIGSIVVSPHDKIEKVIFEPDKGTLKIVSEHSIYSIEELPDLEVSVTNGYPWINYNEYVVILKYNTPKGIKFLQIELYR